MKTKILTSRVRTESQGSLIDNIPKSFLEDKTDGNTILGSGLYGQVYAGRDKSHVLKICDAVSAYSEYVKAIVRYNECAERPNVHMPQIYEVGVFRFPNGRGALAVEMERLTPLYSKEDNDEKLCRAAVNVFSWKYEVDVEYQEFLQKWPDAEEMRVFLDNSFENIQENAGRPGKPKSCYSDMHRGNVMLRIGDIPVVTDPFAG